METFIFLQVTRYESKGLPIVHHYKYVSELPVGHRFAMKKFHGVLRYLRQDNVISMKQVVEPRPLNLNEMSGVHKVEYLKKFFSGLTSADEQRKTGFKWTPGLVQRCQYETGIHFFYFLFFLSHLNKRCVLINHYYLLIKVFSGSVKSFTST